LSSGPPSYLPEFDKQFSDPDFPSPIFYQRTISIFTPLLYTPTSILSRAKSHFHKNEICSELTPFSSSQIFAGSKKEEEGEINMAFLFLGMPNHQPRGYGLRFSSADFRLI